MQIRNKGRILALLTVGLAASIGLAACSNGASTPADTSGPAPSVDTSKFGTIKPGILTVASQGNYLPMEFQKEGSSVWEGATVDLITEIGKRIGLKVEYVNTEYSLLLSGLEAKRFDMASGGIAPNEERLKSADFISYLRSGPSYLIRASQASKLKTPVDMCGLKVGTPRGSSNVEKGVANENKACQAAGKPDIQVETFDTTANGLQSMTTGRIDAYMADTTQGQQIMQQNPGQYAILDNNYQIITWFSGWAFQKDTHKELRGAIADALQAMITDGSYDKILQKYGLTGMGVQKPMLNELPTLPNPR